MPLMIGPETPLPQVGKAEHPTRQGRKLIMLDVEVVAPLLRTKEAAALLAISPWHLDQLRRDGLIKSVHVGSRLIAIIRTTLRSSSGDTVASKLANGRWRGRVYLPGGGERTKVFVSKRQALDWEGS